MVKKTGFAYAFMFCVVQSSTRDDRLVKNLFKCIIKMKISKTVI